MRHEFVQLLAHSVIRITPSLLSEFESLINRSSREEDYHQFLAANPAFIDPLAASVISKQQLGVEYVTDFAVRRHDGEYVVVEIERPQDGIFTSSADFTTRFVHAFGQVVDFQDWVRDNIAYAQKLMPGIAAPRGMLIMGRTADLGNRERGKLRAFVTNSAYIDVLTFDQLLDRARSLFSSVYRFA